jgi:hypothetical protein
MMKYIFFVLITARTAIGPVYFKKNGHDELENFCTILVKIVLFQIVRLPDFGEFLPLSSKNESDLSTKFQR